jgi:hypothetical protein
MAASKHLKREEINAALKVLNQISVDEYGRGLEDLLLDPAPESALRIQRITGIALKRSFSKESPAAPYSRTGARRSWPWADGTPEQQAKDAPKEFAILDQLRMPGPWNERKPLAGTADDLKPIKWEEFKDDADNERGLFKILALYVDDKLKGRDRKSFREYLEAKESRRFEAGLDLSVLLFDAAVTAPVATLLGVPSVAVGVVLVGIQFGYRRATDTSVERVGDRSG